MPELPELEVIREVLQRRMVGKTIRDVDVLPPGGPIVVRDLTGEGLEALLSGATFAGVDRRGKFLVFSFEPQTDLSLAVNFKLTGRLQLAVTGERKPPKTHVIFRLDDETQLRYVDAKRMGQLYLTRTLEEVPGYAGQGPEPLEMSLEIFRKRLKAKSGEVKDVLTRGELVGGVGNAYADEILWEARIYPFRKVRELSAPEVEALHAALHATLLNAIRKVREGMGEAIDQEPRDFMAVHMKAGQPCPRCGSPVSLVGANQRITNFCRTCQPGGLIKGM